MSWIDPSLRKTLPTYIKLGAPTWCRGKVGSVLIGERGGAAGLPASDRYLIYLPTFSGPL